MKTENLTNKQCISIMALYMCGGSLMFGTGKEAKADIWLALLMALLWALVAVMIYSRILSLFPGKDIFDIVKHVFGKFIGSIISLLYIWFCFHLSALIFFDYMEFMNNIGLDSTPKSISILCIIILITCIVKGGIQPFGIWCNFFIIVICALLFFTIFLMLPFMNIKNLQPFLYDGMKPVLFSAFSSFSFPFSEVVVFMGIFNTLRNPNSYYNTYIKGLLLGGFIVIITSLSEMLVLGGDIMLKNFFPFYVSLRIVKYMNFIEGMEITSAVILVVCIFVKSTVCLIVACKGITKLFSIENYKLIIIPICILCAIVSLSDFENMIELVEWDKNVWKYYAFLYQAILPIIILIGSEIKKRQRKKQLTP